MKILVVEDSNTLRYIMTKMLKEFGYKDFHAVENAEEALRLIQKNEYNLMFLDWNLPKMSGFDLLRQLRANEQYNELNIVMVTTIHERAKILKALKVGLQGYILKPLDSKVVLEKLKEIESKLVN